MIRIRTLGELDDLWSLLGESSRACWIWSKKSGQAVHPTYGRVSARRYAYMLRMGHPSLPPKDRLVKLNCGSYTCVNPMHTYLPKPSSRSSHTLAEKHPPARKGQMGGVLISNGRSVRPITNKELDALPEGNRESAAAARNWLATLTANQRRQVARLMQQARYAGWVSQAEAVSKAVKK